METIALNTLDSFEFQENIVKLFTTLGYTNIKTVEKQQLEV